MENLPAFPLGKLYWKQTVFFLKNTEYLQTFVTTDLQTFCFDEKSVNILYSMRNNIICFQYIFSPCLLRFLQNLRALFTRVYLQFSIRTGNVVFFKLFLIKVEGSRTYRLIPCSNQSPDIVIS